MTSAETMDEETNRETVEAEAVEHDLQAPALEEPALACKDTDQSPDAAERINQLIRERDQAEASYRATMAERDQLKAVLEDWAQDLENARQFQAALSAENAVLKAERTRMLEDAKATEALHQEIEQLRLMLGPSPDGVFDLQAACTAMTEEISALTERLRLQELTVEEWRGHLENARQFQAALSAENARLKEEGARLLAAVQDLNVLQQEIERLQALTDAQAAALSDSQADNVKLKDQLSALTASLHLQEKTVEEWRGHLENARQFQAALSAENARLKAEQGSVNQMAPLIPLLARLEDQLSNEERARLEAEAKAETLTQAAQTNEAVLRRRADAALKLPPKLRHKPIVYIHISKTAGMSLLAMLEKALPDLPTLYGTPEGMTADQLQEYGLIAGHFSFFQTKAVPRPRFLFTFLRDPIERTISTYYYLQRYDGEERHAQMARRMSLLEFLRSDDPDIVTFTRNHQTYTIGSDFRTSRSNDQTQLKHAKRNLDTFDFVGFVEDYQSDVSALFAACGLPKPRRIPHVNKSERNELAQDPTVRKLCAELNALDLELYAYARSRRKAAETRPEPGRMMSSVDKGATKHASSRGQSGKNSG